MTQAFLLKTEAAMTNGVVSQKHAKNQASGSNEGTVEPFSSTLDRQVDKQAIQQHKKTDKNDTGDKLVKSGDTGGDTKTGISAEKNGEELPNKLDGTEETDSESSGDNASTATMNAVATSDEATDAEHKAAVIKNNALEASNKEQVAEKGKLAGGVTLTNKVGTELTDQENENSKQKQHAQSLRSDILNALLNKPNTENEKMASAAEQKKVVSSASAIGKQGLSEEQQIMALAKNVKLKGSLSTSSVFERSAGVSSLLLTPAATSSNAAGSTVASGQPILNLQPALQSEAWSRVLSSRVIWMAREGVQQASLKLNPANMGPIEVKLHMHNEQANISFVAQHAATRDALEQALPRLRESFQENGMELAHADVSQQDFSQTDEQDNNKTTNNGSISARNNGDTNIESAIDDVNIIEQDIALGLSVFA